MRNCLLLDITSIEGNDPSAVLRSTEWVRSTAGGTNSAVFLIALYISCLAFERASGTKPRKIWNGIGIVAGKPTGIANLLNSPRADPRPTATGYFLASPRKISVTANMDHGDYTLPSSTMQNTIIQPTAVIRFYRRSKFRERMKRNLYLVTRKCRHYLAFCFLDISKDKFR